MKIFAALLGLVIAALLAPFLLAPEKAAAPQHSEQNLPWQIELLPDGRSKVFGLIPGSSTLADARRSFGGSTQLAIIAPQNSAASLEAYFESVTLGTLTGKAIITLDTTVTELDLLQARAAKTDYMASGTKKHLLNASDLAAAEQRPIRSIAFIPAPNLDEQIILQRFGTPAERIRQGETLEHFLYPAQGLDVVLDSKGKEVLQYVAPARFASLRDPLVNRGR
jgi:hypothetical protein